MTEEVAKQEVLRALDAFHAAQKAGDVAGMLDALSESPKFVSNGVPHGKWHFREFFEAQAKQDVYRHVRVDMSRCTVAVDLDGGDLFSFEGRDQALLGANAVVEPVFHDGLEGRNVWSYVFFKGADQRWRIHS